MENGQGNFEEHNGKTGQNQDIHPAIQHPSMREKRMSQGIHRISERQAKTNNLKNDRHGTDRIENPTQEDHWKAEEVGKSHCLKNFSNSNGDQNAQKGESKTGHH